MMTINGEKSDLPGGTTVRQMLKARNYLFPLLIIKINGATVTRDFWETMTIPEGAQVDVIHLMSGG